MPSLTAKKTVIEKFNGTQGNQEVFDAVTLHFMDIWKSPTFGSRWDDLPNYPKLAPIVVAIKTRLNNLRGDALVTMSQHDGLRVVSAHVPTDLNPAGSNRATILDFAAFWAY